MNLPDIDEAARELGVGDGRPIEVALRCITLWVASGATPSRAGLRTCSNPRLEGGGGLQDLFLR